MMKKKRFLLKLIIFFLPVELAIGIYLVKDPFKVLRYYDNYYTTPRGERTIFINRDHVSCEMLLHNYAANKYDSYIFGSSRSENFRVAKWSGYVNSTKCFHFSAFSETLYGMERKMQLIKERNMEMKNALIIIDHLKLGVVDNIDDHLLRKHYALTKESVFSYQLKNFGDYLNKEVLVKCFLYTFLGPSAPMTPGKKLLIDVLIRSEPYSNELSYPYLDSLHKHDPAAYYTKERVDRFSLVPRTKEQTYREAIIGKEQERLLRNMRQILAEKNTNYKILISPLYDQVKLAPVDQAKLLEIFGAEHVYDLSGQNHITESMYNYYDEAHYSQDIASGIMDSIYAGRPVMTAAQR